MLRLAAPLPVPWQRDPLCPLIIGHRGASAHVTENTVEAFVAARDAGADGVELDVHVCQSGEVIVYHDDDLRRLTGERRRIDSMTLTELRALTLPGGYRIPTLAEVFAALGSTFLINVEIKPPRLRNAGEVVSRVLATLAEHPEPGRLIISSFDPFIVALVRRRAPHLAAGFLFHGGEPLPLRRGWPATFLRVHALHPEHDLITPERAARWHMLGYAINTWTVDEPRAIRRLAELGVNAIIANDPKAARAALGPGLSPSPNLSRSPSGPA